MKARTEVAMVTNRLSVKEQVNCAGYLVAEPHDGETYLQRKGGIRTNSSFHKHTLVTTSPFAYLKLCHPKGNTYFLILNDDQKHATILVYLFIPKQLYVFRAMSSPIIRNT